ncbi:MAG: heavy-metal-associated domain-containing protein [Bacteroides sp.]|nr:heavy-metal-associated domain-containing protein [Roseburia sp.]MCM1345519.1 heavy-metal-associated domain-containing protein [Bacteroides sp.]MCM1420028.1 heavy-metal-associated domain-containing protein [Bacteroides sp.]
MRRIAVMFVVAAICSLSAFAKNMKILVVKTSPEIHDASGEKKVKSGIKLIKGVKFVAADTKSKTVTITYDADKSAANDLLAALEKLGYKAQVVSDKAAPQKSHAIDGVTSASAR